MRKWFRKFCSSGFFIPLVLLLPYVCTILLNSADKALLLSSPDEEVMVPLLLMVQLKGDYEEEAVKAQAVIARSNLYRRLAAGEQAGKIMEEVSGEVTGKNTDRNSGGEYSFILDGTLSPGHLSQIWEMMKKADTLQENKNAADATAGQVLTYQGELKLILSRAIRLRQNCCPNPWL